MNRRQKDEKPDNQEKQPLQRQFGLGGCRTRGLVIWLLLGLALASAVWGPLSNQFSNRTKIE